ncbi:helix-turn-helix domain-containing protein [Gordonia sp. Z-3]|uniref:helix-turn-helix domain-containing protein n=1 Tax=Gordonia sp. Z-3 TaxID=3115408 RepID=UPI002E2D339F|nr:helix-turn-helix domain-containing protein [Gordonia sp. Z-3]MED5803844.1 helix-turn-helix domain-containing protein [Gordonia sp. Z-3]
MVMTSRDQVVLTAEDRAVLEARVRAGTTPQREVLRALIVLLAADGQPTAAIAAEVGICTDTARKWRARFCLRGLAGFGGCPTCWAATDLHPGPQGAGDGMGVSAARRA